jgi:hypothetical protein
MSNPAKDARGPDSCGQAGEDSGHVDDLLVDNREQKVRLVRVTGDCRRRWRAVMRCDPLSPSRGSLSLSDLLSIDAVAPSVVASRHAERHGGSHRASKLMRPGL